MGLNRFPDGRVAVGPGTSCLWQLTCALWPLVARNSIDRKGRSAVVEQRSVNGSFYREQPFRRRKFLLHQ